MVVSAEVIDDVCETGFGEAGLVGSVALEVVGSGEVEGGGEESEGREEVHCG